MNRQPAASLEHPAGADPQHDSDGTEDSALEAGHGDIVHSSDGY